MGELIYLLDTNILSEPTKPKANPKVLQQLNEYSGQYGIAATVWNEFWFGWGRLPDSKRKRRIGSYLQTLEENCLPILPFDARAAKWYGLERSRLAACGRLPSYADGEIAAIAYTRDLVLVTRNEKDFLCFQDLRLENWFANQ